MPQDIERGRQAGFADYISKPIAIGAFLERVNYWVGTKRLPTDHRLQSQ